MTVLRDYQREAVAAVLAGFESGLDRAAVVLPTGSGKTVMFAQLAKIWMDRSDRSRVTILVDRDELVGQTLDKIKAIAPDIAVGVVKAERDELDCRITVASVQTLARARRMERYGSGLSGPGNLVIVDECDLATSASYRSVMDDLGCYDGSAHAVGVTATMKRADGARLGAVWQEVVFERDILSMIPKYLVDVTGKLITVDGLSLAQASISAGDFTAASLTEILSTTGAAEIAAKGYVEHGGDRPGMVFVPSVAASETFQEAFADYGITGDRVWGAQNPRDRRGVVGRFRDNLPGAAQVLINCMALTRGFDAPRAEVAMIARPTLSPVLYQQMVGRVLRPFPGKSYALVLDLAGASIDNRLASLTDLSGRRIRNIRPGESLTQAAARERGERNPLLADYVIDYRDIDMFGSSRARWLQTPMGIWFLAVGRDLLFLWPDGQDGYRVGHRPLTGRAGGRFIATGLSLEWAMSRAEEHAASLPDSTGKGADLVSARASWRSKRPGPKVLTLARDLGVSSAGNAGAVSDRINIERARRVLDMGLSGRS